jgi:uncharacterized RDD family membrane protein YckC
VSGSEAGPEIARDGAVVPPQPEYAGFWRRTLAFIIDFVLINIVAWILLVPPSAVLGFTMDGIVPAEHLGAVVQIFGYLLGLLLSWLYFTLLESSRWQATVGKKVLGLRVADQMHRRIGFGRANARYWSKNLSALIFGTGFLMIGLSARKQGLHDRIASTIVLRGRLGVLPPSVNVDAPLPGPDSHLVAASD